MHMQRDTVVCVWLICLSTGYIGALHRSEGNTPTSAEAQRRQQEDAAAAPGAKGDPDQRTGRCKILRRSSGFQVGVMSDGRMWLKRWKNQSLLLLPWVYQ